MKFSKILSFCLLFLFGTALSAQINFTNQKKLLNPVNQYNGVAMAVVDMNSDGRDDIVRLNQANLLSIEFQNAPNAPFEHLEIGPVSGANIWGVCAADIDNNGKPDVLLGGSYNGIFVARANADASAYTLSTLTAPGTFVQGVNYADINNDGWLDAFVCHDDGPSRFFMNDGTGALNYNPNVMDYTTVPASDNSGNYGSIWSDIDNDGDVDLYVAKCRQNVNEPTDGRRINMLFINNGDGTYTQDLTNASGLRIGAQSWTADFGDIDNDGDFDCFITNHDITSQLLENDGAGHFTDITAFSGLFNAVGGLPIQGVFRDFDNDGFLDILVAGTAQYLFHNNGNKTFTELPNLFGTAVMESCAVGDLNNDGFPDIYAGYAGVFNQPSTIPDALWMNAGNDHHFFGLNLRGTTSNYNAVGTKVFLYSALGTQVREVRAGESYGIANSMQVQFGLDTLKVVDSVRVNFPSGFTILLEQPAIDQYLTLEEAKCLVPPVPIYADGPTTFCSGQGVNLLTGGFYATYAWSTGDTTSQIHVNTAGMYRVTVSSLNGGCTVISSPITVVADPVETPQITVIGDTLLCEGTSVLLRANDAPKYWWSTGENTQTIEVHTPGVYSVATQGLCGVDTSAVLSITVFPNPLPVTTNDTVAVNGLAQLQASGTEVSWFDAATGGAEIFTGNNFQTGNLTVSDTFWVSNRSASDLPNVFTGMPDHAGTSFAGAGFNGAVIFDCFKPFKLAKTKVYTDLAGVREIVLRNADNDLLQSALVDIPAGTTVIDLNFDVPVGTGLALTTNNQTNLANFGTASPQLRRSDANLAYPYVVPNVVSINRSNTAQGIDRYYYFYNWEIDFYETICETERVPVYAVVDTALVAVSDLRLNTAWQVYPNPATTEVYVQTTQFEGGSLAITLRNAQGALVHSVQTRSTAGAFRYPLNLNQLPAGIYFVEIATEKGRVIQKVVLR